jgi:hypothetical protein
MDAAETLLLTSVCVSSCHRLGCHQQFEFGDMGLRSLFCRCLGYLCYDSAPGEHSCCWIIGSGYTAHQRHAYAGSRAL